VKLSIQIGERECTSKRSDGQDGASTQGKKHPKNENNWTSMTKVDKEGKGR